jgi:hypothetical protein
MYYEKSSMIEVRGTIAESIINVIPVTEKIVDTIDKNSSLKEYIFCIENFISENENTRKSDVSFTYTIEVVCSNDSFPISYKLFDLTNNEEVVMNDKNTTDKICIYNNEQISRKYKLIVEWNNDKTNLSDEVDIDLNINVEQIN